MLQVTTNPHGLIAFVFMLLNTGTQLTWHCREKVNTFNSSNKHIFIFKKDDTK